MSLSRVHEKLFILLVTLLAFWLRTHQLAAQSYWIDEAWTVYFANLELIDLWHLLQTAEIKPPFYLPSTIYWVKMLGDSEYALRFYSVLFGVMAIPFTYRLGRDLGDGRLGLLVALLMTVAPFQIWHSQEARLYSILTAASVMSMWGFINIWQRGGWRWWLVYVLGTEWAILVHYHGLALIGIQGLFLLLTWRRHWRGYLRWVGSLVVIFLLYIPWLVFGANLLQNYLNWIEQPSLWQALMRSVIAYSLNELVPPKQAMVLILPFVASYLLGLVYAARRSWGRWRGPEMLSFLLAYTLAPIVASWLYGLLRTPAFLERYLILIQVGYLLTVSVGVLALLDGLPHLLSPRASAPSVRTQWVGPVVALLITVLMLSINAWVLYHYYTDPAYARPNWRGIAETVQAFEQPGDAVIITGDDGDKAFNYYYRGASSLYLDFNTPVPPPEEAHRHLEKIAAEHDRIWFSAYGAPIDSLIESWLAKNSFPAWHTWLGRKRLALYQVTADLSRLENLNEIIGDGLMLVSVELPQDAIDAGNPVPLALTWKTENPLSTDYQLSVRLINGYGDVFAQSDWPPFGPTSTWSPGLSIVDQRSILLPPDLPPGDYLLQLVLYDPLVGQELGSPVTIPNIQVSPSEIIPPLSLLNIPNATQPVRPGDKRLRLVGYNFPDAVQPGQPMWLWLYWQAGTQLTPDSQLEISLESNGEAITETQPLAIAVGPVDSWQPGQVRRAIYHIATSPHLQGSSANIKVLLREPEKGAVEFSIGQLALQVRDREYRPPEISQALEVRFGDPATAVLLGVDLPNEVVLPGDQLPLTLHWQALAETEINYTVFVQLLDPTNQVVVQVDQQPQGGQAPTRTWILGEIITDPYTLSLPADLPSGQYRLITGLYDAVSGSRLPVGPGRDFVELPQVTVR